MVRRPGVAVYLLSLLLVALSACSSSGNTPADVTPVIRQTIPPTPESEILQVSDTRSDMARLHVTLPSIMLPAHDPTLGVQLFLVMADAHGRFSYLLYPANSPGYPTEQFDLRSHPLELSVDETTSTVTLWILAVHNTRYVAAEMLGLDTLIASLALGFRNWLATGDPLDDPLAGVVSASDGVLYEWFAGIDVIGQSVITLDGTETWEVDFDSARSPDGGLNTVYSIQYLEAAHDDDDPADAGMTRTPVPTAPIITTPTPAVPVMTLDERQYTLVIDESFDDGDTAYTWYEGGDSTYQNALVNGAYQIELIDITQRDFGLSWGSLEDLYLENYVLAAEIELVEEDVEQAYYGVWFHYQDGKNFIYFGISNTGEYRVAVIKDNQNLLEVHDWAPDSAVKPGAASNLLTVEAQTGGTFILSINHEQVLTFTDQTYAGGSVAFFCRAKSVPATCRLNRLRIWSREE